MGKIDKAKERLNTLRAYFASNLVLMLAIGGGLASSYRSNTFDALFWMGVASEIVMMFFGLAIVGKIKKITDEIEGL